MYQENVRYGTRKKVRRRPADFRSRADIQQLKRYMQNTDFYWWITLTLACVAQAGPKPKFLRFSYKHYDRRHYILPSIQKKVERSVRIAVSDYDRYRTNETWIKQQVLNWSLAVHLGDIIVGKTIDERFPNHYVCCFIVFLRDAHLPPRLSVTNIDETFSFALGLVKASLAIRKRKKIQQVLTFQANGLQCHLISNTDAFRLLQPLRNIKKWRRCLRKQ